MLTKVDLLTQDTLPHINDISLELYKEFSVDILFNRRFHYYFNDGSDIILEFREWGIYHMLAIQHIDIRIGKKHFFEKIDQGLKLGDFEKDKAVKMRYRKQKERITMFSCLYHSLENGTAFYIPTQQVKNTNSVKVSYIIFHTVSEKGMNIGLKKVGSVYVPITILISKAAKLNKYVEDAEYKLVRRLDIIDESNRVIQTKSYAIVE